MSGLVGLQIKHYNCRNFIEPSHQDKSIGLNYLTRVWYESHIRSSNLLIGFQKVHADMVSRIRNKHNYAIFLLYLSSANAFQMVLLV